MAWDFFAHIRMMELLYHKMQAPVLEQYQLTQIELDVLLFLAHHPHLDTAKDIVEVRRLTKSHVSAAVERLVCREYLQRVRHPGNKKLIHLTVLPAAAPVVAAGEAQQAAFFETLRQDFSEEEATVLFEMLSRIEENTRQAYLQS